MTAKIEKGFLIITIPVNATPKLSSTGKSKVVASSSGNVATSVIVEGKPLTIGVNAYIKA